MAAEDKPGYIFIRQQISPEDGDKPVGLYKVEATDQDETPLHQTECGYHRLKLLPNTYFSVSSIKEAKSAVYRALRTYTDRFLREGWYKVSEEEFDSFIGLYAAIMLAWNVKAKQLSIN